MYLCISIDFYLKTFYKMAKLKISPSGFGMVKKTLEVSAPTGGTMGSVASSNKSPNTMDSKKPLNEVAIVTEQLNFAPQRIGIKGLGEVPVQVIETLLKKDPSLANQGIVSPSLAKGGYTGDAAQLLKGIFGKLKIEPYTLGSKTADKMGVRNYIQDSIKKVSQYKR